MTAALAAGCAWLDAWRTEARGVTIGPNGDVNVWWLPEPALADRERALLDQLDVDADLKSAVKTIVHAEAMVRSGTGRAVAA